MWPWTVSHLIELPFSQLETWVNLHHHLGLWYDRYELQAGLEGQAYLKCPFFLSYLARVYSRRGRHKCRLSFLETSIWISFDLNYQLCAQNGAVSQTCRVERRPLGSWSLDTWEVSSGIWCLYLRDEEGLYQGTDHSDTCEVVQVGAMVLGNSLSFQYVFALMVIYSFWYWVLSWALTQPGNLFFICITIGSRPKEVIFLNSKKIWTVLYWLSSLYLDQ
jgi:hypothetical protein